jgi:hypothetical protein
MPPDAGSIDWDFPALVDAWNLYGLPALLIVVGAVFVIRHFTRGASERAAGHGEWSSQRATGPRRITVRTIALIHVGLAIRAGIGLAQELMTLRTQGVPQSFPVTGIVAPTVAVLMNLTVGHGLWHLRPWGRRVAIGWDALVAILTALIAAWQWKYQATVRLDQWPDYLVSDGLPWFLLAVMLLPATRAVFATPAPPAAGSRSSPLTTAAILLLVVVTSTILVDAAGWAAVSLDEPAAPSLPGP